MTRANLLIVDADGGRHRFRWSNSASPDAVLPFLAALGTVAADGDVDCDWLAEHNPAGALRLGQVGNPSYFYEIDLGPTPPAIRAWYSRIVWRDAPPDWRARGWHCYPGPDGREGYHHWIKGARVPVPEPQETIPC